MNKIRKIVLLLFMLIMPLLAFSQYAFLHANTQKEIDRLNEKINKALKKYKTYSIEDTTTQLFIYYHFRIKDPISKNELATGSFLQKLDPVYLSYPKSKFPAKKYKDSLLLATISIYSIKEKEIALFNYQDKVFIRYKDENYHRPQCYDAFVKHFWGKKNLLVFFGFDVLGDVDSFYFVNEQSEVFVFFNDDDNSYKTLPVKEFIDKFWDRFSKRDRGRYTD